jgi:hypothetical protein
LLQTVPFEIAALAKQGFAQDWPLSMPHPPTRHLHVAYIISFMYFATHCYSGSKRK